jgi:hypothetical protein
VHVSRYIPVQFRVRAKVSLRVQVGVRVKARLRVQMRLPYIGIPAADMQVGETGEQDHRHCHDERQ